MQMFNGITMGVFDSYRIYFGPEDEGGTPEQTTEDLRLKQVSDNIDKLRNTIDDIDAKNNLNDLLTKEFLGDFVNTLSQEQKDKLKQDISSILETHKTEQNFSTEYKGLIDLATTLGVEGYNKTVNEKDLGIAGEISDDKVTKLEAGMENVGAFYEDGKKVETAPERVGSIKTNINAQLNKLNELLCDDEYKDDAHLNKMNGLLKNIQEIMENPVPENVKLLQEYISENLDDTMVADDNKYKNFIQEFNAKNKKNGEFDGKFGVSTKSGLEKVLEKTNKYITDTENNSKEAKISKIEAPTDPVRVEKGTTDPKDLLKNITLPEGAEVTFDNEDQAKKDLSIPGEHSINIKVAIPDSSYERAITVRVKVEEENQSGTPESENHGPQATVPLNLGEQQYQVIGNAKTLYKNLGSDVVLYSVEKSTTKLEPSGDGQYATVEAVHDTDIDKEYYAKLDKSNNIYKIKLDKNGYLCPVAEKYTPNGNNYITTDVLIGNNSSCICYLKNKLPTELKPGPNEPEKCIIKWDSRSIVNDYTLTSHGRTLTIEPMTIAGDWISTDLGRNLAFLNLTNYIRATGDVYKKPDPDVNRKVDKFRGIKVNKDRLQIDKDAHGLSKASAEELAKFKRYNNGEQWDDNWDQKRKNKIYKKIQL